MVGRVAVAVWVNRALDRLGQQRGRSVAAEDFQRVQLGFRCHTRRDSQCAEIDAWAVWAVIRCAIGGDAKAGREPGGVGAPAGVCVGLVAFAWVGVGRGRIAAAGCAGIIAIASEVKSVDLSGWE